MVAARFRRRTGRDRGCAVCLLAGDRFADRNIGRDGSGNAAKVVGGAVRPAWCASRRRFLLETGLPLEPWSIRGPVLVAVAIVAFGLTVRPLGLVVAGPVAIIIAAFASDEVRWVETIVVGVLMTAVCVGLFKFALGLPIPPAPWLIGY